MVIIPCFQKVLHRTLKNGRSANVQIRLSERNCYVRLYQQPLEELHRHQVVILNHSLSGLSNVVRIATAKVDQGAASLTRPTDSHPGFLKFLTRFHKKINPQKSSKDFDAQNPEKIINNGATTRRHAPSQIRDDPRPSPSDLCKHAQNFTKLTLQESCTALELQNLKI